MAYTTIDDPSEYFTTTLYTGNGSDAHSITNSANSGNFKPDWVWTKNRTGTARNHSIFDSSRGINKYLYTNQTDAEADVSVSLQSFDTNGFTVGTSTQLNPDGNSMVAWQWKANGGTTSSNTDGTITSTVQANTTAGFSIVTFTGTSNNVTTGHGLNQAPEIFFAKSRASGSTNWNTYTSVIDGSLDYLFLNSTNAAGNASNSLPTSSVLYTNQTDSSVAYCFHSVKGYSKIGKYTGNNSTNGVFVYTGFKPAWLMVKRTSGTANWDITTAAISQNQIDERLRANLTNAEESSGYVDFLSNGFKMRNTNSSQNNGTYIYMAFAEHPFVSSKGVPVTAR